MRHSRSVDLSSTRFPDLVTAGRTERGWSKADLAAKAGLSTKVIHQIESRSRSRFFEKTLMLVADALGAGLEELLRPADDTQAAAALDAPPSDVAQKKLLTSLPHQDGIKRRRRRTFSLLAAFFAATILLVAGTQLLSSSPVVKIPRVEIHDRTVRVSDPAGGKLIWTRAFEAKVKQAEPSPWKDGSVVVGLGHDTPNGGKVLLLDGRKGATIWERSPDVELAARAFGHEILDNLAGFSQNQMRSVDLNGDGRPELAVSFFHIRHYPSCVMLIDRNGTVIGEYFNRGHVYDMLAVDLDGNGRQALVCGGCNNKEPYHGGAVFILDREHCRGAAVDPYNGGNLDVGDGSRSRILLPAFEPQMMQWLGAARLAPERIMASASLEGDINLVVSVGYDGLIMHLILDASLNPLALRPTDIVPMTVSSWPVDDPANYGPNCPRWREQWLQQIIQVSPQQQTLLTHR
jgi:transcriptional regulator with XRE-family HTH domain